MTCTEPAVERIAPRADATLSQWEDWLCQLEADGSASESERFSLLETASSRARSEESLEWAALAVRAAALLASFDQGHYRHIAELEAMRLRVRFIVKFGSHPSHTVLDREIVPTWFMDSLPFTSSRAKEMLNRMEGDQPLNSQELRTLRLVGSRLALVQELAACGELSRSADLGAWLAIDHPLP